MSIQVSYTKEGNINILRLKGRFVGADAESFVKEIDTHFASEASPKMVIDLNKLEYIGSQGTSSLVVLAARYQVKITCASPLVKNTFSVLNLDQILEIYESVKDALASFSKT